MTSRHLFPERSKMSRATVHRGRVAVLGLGRSFSTSRGVSHSSSCPGIGVAGLTALKNLLEQGFDVTGFEKNDYVGGLWQYNEDPNQTTVLKGRHAIRAKAKPH
jgi:hypothetical protein